MAIRHLLAVSLTLVGLFASQGLSNTIAVDQECVSAIFGIVGGLSFEGIGYGNYYLAICQNPLKVTSIYAISKTYCPPNDLDPGFAYLNLACQKNGGMKLMPEADVAANLTDEAISRFPIIDQTDGGSKKNLTTPILISRDWFNLGFRTEDTWDYENRTHPIYGFAMYGFWGGVLLIGTLHRLITIILESRLSPSSTGSEDTGIVDTPSYYSKCLPPYRRQLLFGCTIPTRIEFLVVLLYWVISFVLCCVNYRAFKGNLYWSPEAPQIGRYIADRTGIIAYANLPLMWLFSGRNNIFIWVTGWQFSTFNLFHRHIARITTLQAIIHSIRYTAFYFTADWVDTYREQFHDAWFCLGIVATIAMSFLVFFSFSWFRRRLYDSFLLIHITLSIVLIVALFYHTSIFDGQYEPYLWPLVAIWSFERLLRILRINTHAKPRPGQHYFLYQPFRFTGWENHPFTLAHWSQSAAETAQSLHRGQTGSLATNTTTEMPSGTACSSIATSFEAGLPRAAIEDEYLLSFWIRPYDGWTRHLRDLCLKSQSLSQLPAISKQVILLEGPYGMAKPLWAFDEVLLIAGGSGISAMVPYILDHVARATAPSKSSQTRIRRLTLVWSNRKEVFIHRIAQQELAAALTRDDITCLFYCTDSAKASIPLPLSDEITMGDAKKVTAESSVLKGKEEADMTESTDGTGEAGSLAIAMCRPDIPKLIERAAAAATDTRSRLAVMACGPGGMADAAREATYRAMRQQNNSIEYFEQAFGW